MCMCWGRFGSGWWVGVEGLGGCEKQVVWGCFDWAEQRRQRVQLGLNTGTSADQRSRAHSCSSPEGPERTAPRPRDSPPTTHCIPPSPCQPNPCTAATHLDALACVALVPNPGGVQQHGHVVAGRPVPRLHHPVQPAQVTHVRITRAQPPAPPQLVAAAAARVAGAVQADGGAGAPAPGGLGHAEHVVPPVRPRGRGRRRGRLGGGRPGGGGAGGLLTQPSAGLPLPPPRLLPLLLHRIQPQPFQCVGEPPVCVHVPEPTPQLPRQQVGDEADRR